MGGFAGIARNSPRPITAETLCLMAGAIRHRGPDDWDTLISGRVGLAHVRLCIVDKDGGAQPLSNADGSIVICHDGEVYNYRELRTELESSGYRFRTASDTEVLVHAYQRWGEAMLERLNGQFAFALYDRRNDLLFLARDRFGVQPLFFSSVRGDFYFGSEAKSLFASGEVTAAPDLRGVDELFSLGAARAPRTAFRDVQQLEPGCCCTWSSGRLRVRRYYHPHYLEGSVEPAGALETLDHLMQSSVGLRIRDDVPVGGYLRGGLDSSIVCALAARMSPQKLRTFSVTFDDPRYDESEQQEAVARLLSTEHEVVRIGAAAVADVFPDVVRHAETPLLRTAPAPMYLLARAAREAGIKVVLSGEGSDELFLGHDLFKETVVRLFCLRQPESRLRPKLFDRLYPFPASAPRAGEFWRRFLLTAGTIDDPLFSHAPRYLLASRIKDFYSVDSRIALAGSDPLAELRQSLPDAFGSWSAENRAAYLELTTLLPSYLLSSHGDRMAMAHGVEGRFPFLDHRVFEFASSLPTWSKLLGLRDKEILRRWASHFLPASVARRSRQPYRASDAASFFHRSAPEYVRELLSREAIRRTGIFDAASVEGLVRRCIAGRVTSTGENQALVAILSTQLWHQSFIEQPIEATIRRTGTGRGFAVPV
jgi:asparagine synthase (glutamine-hydrolysing)